MTTPENAPAVEPDDDEYDELPLTERAVVRISIKRTFSHRGVQHWPGVEIEDGPGVVTEIGEDEDGNQVEYQRVETGEELVYRVNEIAHRTTNAVIARMKRDIDTQAEADNAARARAQKES